jgi:hypothetical protein
MDLDPILLTFENLAEHLRSDGGPAWRAAIVYGIDVMLLKRNLALSPTERMRQNDEALRLYFEHQHRTHGIGPLRSEPDHGRLAGAGLLCAAADLREVAVGVEDDLGELLNP